MIALAAAPAAGACHFQPRALGEASHEGVPTVARLYLFPFCEGPVQLQLTFDAFTEPNAAVIPALLDISGASGGCLFVQCGGAEIAEGLFTVESPSFGVHLLGWKAGATHAAMQWAAVGSIDRASAAFVYTIPPGI